MTPIVDVGEELIVTWIKKGEYEKAIAFALLEIYKELRSIRSALEEANESEK